MSPRQEKSYDLIVSKALPLRRKLKVVKITADEKAPAAAVELLSEFAAMATELQRIRPREEAKEKAPNTTPKEPQLRCEKYNTWWDAIRTLMGFPSQWEACMCDNYGGEWCD
jgi:hypothetical protein